MPAWTLATAQSQLALWVAAEAAIATNQAYSVGGRALTRANLREVGERIAFYQRLVAQLERGGVRIRQGVPL